MHVAQPDDGRLALGRQQQVFERPGRARVPARAEDGGVPGDDDRAVAGVGDAQRAALRLRGQRVLQQHDPDLRLVALHRLHRRRVAAGDPGAVLAKLGEEAGAVLLLQEHRPGEAGARGERVDQRHLALPARLGQLAKRRRRLARKVCAVHQHHRRQPARGVGGVRVDQRPGNAQRVGRGVGQQPAFALEALVQERVRGDEQVGLGAAGGQLGLEPVGHLLAAGLVPVHGDAGQRLGHQRVERVEHLAVHRGVDPQLAARSVRRVAPAALGRARSRRFDAAAGEGGAAEQQGQR